MDIVKKIAFILLIIGGLNWGLVGLFEEDLVSYLPDALAVAVYVLVGISAVIVLFGMKSCNKTCSSEQKDGMPTSSSLSSSDSENSDPVQGSQM